MSRRHGSWAPQPAPQRGWLRRNAGNIAAGAALVGVGVAVSAAGNPYHGGAAILKGLAVIGGGSLKAGLAVAAGAPVAAKIAADRAVTNGACVR